MVFRRHTDNPILTRADIPDVPPTIVDATSVFNPGAVKHDGRYLLLLRVQTRGRETHMMLAESSDGVRFDVRPRIIPVDGLERIGGSVYHIYDPRITRLDDTFFVMFAADTDKGCRIGLARTDDFERLLLIGLGDGCEGGAGDGCDVRNGVLFPERVGGRYLRLDRPNVKRLESGVTTGDEIFLSESDDLKSWRALGPVMQGRWHYWDELIGSGPPPVKTREGWLLIYHGIATHLSGSLIYQAGVALLDLEDPTRVIARGRDNILEPREPYELVGQVPNVIFPGGMIVDDYDDDGFALPESRVLLYYGAADTSVCLATTTVTELLRACRV